MDLYDVLPWLWCAVALVAAVRTRCHGGAAWWGPCLFALLLATVHLWGWNKPIYHAGREALVWLGLHDERLWFKVAIGLVFFPLVGWLLWWGWRASKHLPAALRLALLAMATDALYITIRTLSVDGWMPLVIGIEPGKSRFGASLAAVALLAVLVSRMDPGAEVVDAVR